MAAMPVLEISIARGDSICYCDFEIILIDRLTNADRKSNLLGV
jgi:hypothetical protein